MRDAKTVLVILALAGLSGCSFTEKVGAKVAPDTLSLADRCGQIMQAAMPFARLDLGDRAARSPDVRTIIAQVGASRTDVPRDAPGGGDVAAECTFENNVMTAFHWTKGGPPPPPAQPTGTPPPASPASGNAPPASPPRSSR